MADDGAWNRRSLLRGAAVVAGVAATTPLLGKRAKVRANGGKGGESAAVLFGETAERLQIRIDHDRPLGTFAQSRPAVTYPCYPKEIRLGDAVAKGVYCETNPNATPAPFGFDVPAAFFHRFHKPYNVTLDFTGMNLYIARGKAA
ncbi:hypothetical protein ACFVH6_37685 [Spirillospora sp. NPDC127200]